MKAAPLHPQEEARLTALDELDVRHRPPAPPAHAGAVEDNHPKGVAFCMRLPLRPPS